MLNISELMKKIEAEPYSDRKIRTPHCGILKFSGLKAGDEVSGPSGEWAEIPGTCLARIERERNVRDICAAEKGIVEEVAAELDGAYAEAGTEFMTVRHWLTKDEVVQLFLLETLDIVRAPERAKYFFSPEIDKKMKFGGGHTVRIETGSELFIVSKMKREVPMPYTGPAAIIYASYFNNGQSVEEGAPLVGTCSPDMVAELESAIRHIRFEWVERNG